MQVLKTAGLYLAALIVVGVVACGFFFMAAFFFGYGVSAGLVGGLFGLAAIILMLAERKRYSRKPWIASMLAACLLGVACSTTWVTEAINISNMLLPIALNVFNLVGAMEGKGTSPSDTALARKWSNELTTDLTTVKTLLDEWNKASAADRPGIMARINDALAVTNGHLGELLPALHITNPQTQAKVEAVVGLVVAEVQAIESLVASAQGKASVVKGSRPVMSAKDLKATYNRIIVSPTGDGDLDLVTPKLVLK